MHIWKQKDLILKLLVYDALAAVLNFNMAALTANGKYFTNGFLKKQYLKSHVSQSGANKMQFA